MKPKRVRPMNAAEQRHVSRLIEMGCLVCGRPAEYHHIHTNGYEKQLRDHRFGAPLCENHHRGPFGIHSLGHDEFTAETGVNLYVWAHEQWAESEAIEQRRNAA